MDLYLSQHLIILNRYTISVQGETDNYFQTCNEYGCCDWLPTNNEVWFALTDKAREVFIGKTKNGEDDLLLGRLFVYRESDEFIKGE